jgi:hypothetical protein
MVMIHGDSERIQNPRPQVELRSAAAELLVLRRAIEVARAEARSAARRPCRKPPPGLCQHPLSP